jgi:hypothetical protein
MPTPAEIPVARTQLRLPIYGRLLLVSLVALFVLPSLLDSAGLGEVAASVLFTAVMFSALLAVHGERQGMIVGLIVLTPPLLFLWLRHFRVVGGGGLLEVINLLYLIILVAFATWRLIRFVLQASHVDAEVLAAGVSTYLLLGLLWSFFFLVVDVLHPGSFRLEPLSASRRLDESASFYFSLCTLTTAGYGDITPLSREARAVATMESVTGVLYIGVLIARLVSLYSSRRETGRSGS